MYVHICEHYACMPAYAYSYTHTLMYRQLFQIRQIRFQFEICKVPILHVLQLKLLKSCSKVVKKLFEFLTLNSN